MPAFEIKGWCPSVHRPMASGDGLLIRARSKHPALTSQQLRAVADIACDCGNGLVDLTQRAQLQLRGVSTLTLDEARQRLADHELYFPAQESLVDILSAAFDAKGLIQALAKSESDATIHGLPPKFLISIETGSEITLAGAQADIRIEAIDATHFAIGVAGAPDRSVIVAEEDVAATARALMRAFMKLRAARPAELRRMRHVVAALGVAAVAREAGLTMQPYEWRAPIYARSVLGLKQAETAAVAGVAANCGRWRASELAALSELAKEFGDSIVAPTHWRVFFIPARNLEAAQRILDAAHALGLIVSPDDPRLAIVACPGAPECAQAAGETRAHLAQLAPLAQKLAGEDGVGLHVSGCAKGCARPAASPVTLVCSGDGFNLVETGPASDAPHLERLDINAVENALTMRAKENPCPTP